MASGARTAINLGLAFLLTGASFDAPSLYVPAVALLALATLAAAWVALAARGAGVERLPGPPTVVENQPYPLRIRLRRGAVRPYGELIDPLLAAPVPLGFGLPAPDTDPAAEGRDVVLTGEASFPRRGQRTLEPARLIIRDPLGIRARELAGLEEGEILVLPRVEPVIAAGERHGEEGDSLAGASDGVGGGLRATVDVEVDGLRPYREGSPASRIHWPAVARHGELIERRLVSGGEGTAVVVLDSEHPEDDHALDRAVRAAASLCVHLARSGGCLLIVAGERRPMRIDPQLRGWPQAHARLAVVEPGRALAVRPLIAGGTSVWVTARGANAARGALDTGASILVTPLPPDGAEPVFTVAGCTGLLVGAFHAAEGRMARNAA